MLTERRIEILKAIVKEFIETAEPVGSKTLLDKYKWPYSSATVRNEMSTLEEMGLIEKTHASSGRIPSIDGYRFYVQYIMDEPDNQKMELALNSIFEQRQQNVEAALMESVDILSQMTNLTTGILGAESQQQSLEKVESLVYDSDCALVTFETNLGHRESKVFRLENGTVVEDLSKYVAILNDRLTGTPLHQLVEKMELIRPIIAQSIQAYERLFEAFSTAFVKFASDKVYFSGKNNLLNQPEFADVNKLKQLLNMLEDSSMWNEIYTGNPIQLEHSSRTHLYWVEDVAIVSSPIVIEDQERQLMVVGPSRMDYDSVVALVEYVSSLIEKVYGTKE